MFFGGLLAPLFDVRVCIKAAFRLNQSTAGLFTYKCRSALPLRRHQIALLRKLHPPPTLPMLLVLEEIWLDIQLVGHF